VLLVSMIKGWVYVLVTSILIYGLIQAVFKRIMVANDQLQRANNGLEQSNALCKRLNQEFDEKQNLLKSLIDSIPDLVFYKNRNSIYLGCNKAFEVFAGQSE
jgi:PAS domain-containing protein